MLTNLQSYTTLNNGVKMPWLGLGVYKAKDGDEIISAVRAAIRHGYRSIDGAAFYDNERGLGQGVRAAMQELGLSREELFITSKVWNSDLREEKTEQAFEESLERLGLDYLDLYLIHWPVVGKYQKAWHTLEKLYQKGRIRAIGVSNFKVHHLEDILRGSDIVPAVNQVERSPRFPQQELHAYCKEKGIQLEAWAPLARGLMKDDPTLKAIADKHGKTFAQILLRWNLQSGVVAIPKSVNESRIIQNADIFDFELDAQDMAAIATLDTNTRMGHDPDTITF